MTSIRIRWIESNCQMAALWKGPALYVGITTVSMSSVHSLACAPTCAEHQMCNAQNA